MRMANTDRVPRQLVALATQAQEQVLEELRTSTQGLAAGEVTERRARFGANRIAHEEHLPLLVHFLRRLVNPLNLLLLSLATLSLLLGDRQSPVMIFLMVILSVSLSLI